MPKTRRVARLEETLKDEHPYFSESFPQELQLYGIFPFLDLNDAASLCLAFPSRAF